MCDRHRGPIEPWILLDDGRFRAMANTKGTRFPEATDITCKLRAFYRLESRSHNLLTMIGSSPTIPGQFVRIRAGIKSRGWDLAPVVRFCNNPLYIHSERDAWIDCKRILQKRVARKAWNHAIMLSRIEFPFVMYIVIRFLFNRFIPSLVKSECLSPI